MGGLIGMMLAATPKNPIRKLVLNDVGPFIPKAQFVEVADTGHAPALMDGAQIDLVRKWLI